VYGVKDDRNAAARVWDAHEVAGKEISKLIPIALTLDSWRPGIGPDFRFDSFRHRLMTMEALMSAAVKIIRTDRTAEELRGVAAKSNEVGKCGGFWRWR
jgi:hypothetical protein